MATIASLRILLGLDSSGVKTGASKVNDDLKAVQRQANATNDTLRNIGKGITAGFGLGAGIGAFNLATTATRAFVGGVSDSVDAARDLTETINKSKVVFGPAAAEIQRFGETSATALGLSKNAAIGAAATFGNLFVSLGTAPADVAPMSRALVTLAGDLASFNNISVDEALTSLRSGIVGEVEPMRRLGVAINAAAVDAEAAAMGFRRFNGQFTEGEKVQARYALILKQTGTSQGDFSRTSQDLANQQRILDAQLENVSAQLGTAMIPLLTELARVINNDVIPALSGVVTEDLPDFAENSAREIGQLTDALRFIASPLGNLADLWRSNAALAGASGQATASVTKATVDHAIAIVEANKWTGEANTAQKALNATLATTGTTMLGAGKGTDALSDMLLTFANNAKIANRDLKDLVFTLGTVNIMGENLLPGGMTLGESHLEDQRQDQKNADDAAGRERERERERQRLAAEGAANAKRNAAELASAYKDRLGDAFDAVKRSAHQFFDDLHQRNLDAIRDVRDLANAALEEQQKAIRGAVDAERTRVAAIRTRRQEQGLRAAVGVATDPEELARAQRALNDFLDDQRIAFLSNQADAQIAALDAQKAANDKLAADAITAENERNQAQVAAFDFELAALQKKLSDHPKAWASTQQDVLKLLMAFGVDYKKAGESLGQQFADGLLASTRAAEEAAAALAAAAGVPVGATPKRPGEAVPPVAGGAVGGVAPSAAVAAGLAPREIVIHTHLHLDGAQIAEVVERYQFNLEGIYAPTPVSTGSQR